MKTDDLIAMLSTNVTAVDRWQMSRTLAAAVGLGAATALGAALIVLGCRTDIGSDGPLAFLIGKLVFAVAVTSLAFSYLVRVARPGDLPRRWRLLVALPFVGVAGLALISLAFAPRVHWQSMLLGDEWLQCLLSIPIIAIVPFALVIWAVRQASPTDLRRAGGCRRPHRRGRNDLRYALHCTTDSLPFVALWYGATILLCTLAGASLGSRLLRW